TSSASSEREMVRVGIDSVYVYSVHYRLCPAGALYATQGMHDDPSEARVTRTLRLEVADEVAPERIQSATARS
ncbi:MAG: hypothetical protein WDA16_07480, partial [Candidatus Thermoplasmatota archaeon]